MSTPTINTLLQGLFDCGGYEKGHAFIREHTSDLTWEFVSALRAQSMNLLTGEHAAPELAPVFADLAIVAAIVIGEDDEKGMSLYCKGEVLSRMERYQEAIPVLEEAQAYLRTGKHTQQLGHCLFDTARCYDMVGEPAEAVLLLDEVLACQSNEQERVKTLAYMFVLESRSGNLINADDIKDLVRRAHTSSSDRAMDFREVTDPGEKRGICEALLSHHPQLRDNRLFKESVPGFIASRQCWFFTGEDIATTPAAWPPYAYGMLKQYRDNFNDKDLLGLEAVCFGDSDSRSHLKVLENLKKMAQDLNALTLYIAEKSLSHPASFRALLRQSGIRELPQVLMQRIEPWGYSAFSESLETAAFVARCIPVRVQAERWDFAGAVAAGSAPLYRGEGRLERQSKREGWHCSSLEELSQHFFHNGFPARSEGTFSGAMQEQLLHQGYVDQPTVSLSESDTVCAHYATDKNRNKGGGVVFKINRAGLLKRGRIYDSLATLKKGCPWVLGGFYDLMEKVMRALDEGRNDIRVSGAFLQKCHVESRRRVERFGGGRTLGPKVEWRKLLGNDVLRKLEAQEISEEALDGMNEEFEGHWSVALGKMTGMDVIDVGKSGSYKSIELSRAYFRAFYEVQPKLKEAWRLNQFSQFNNPGWDVTPFGYITKTIRDKEFFACGDVPGDCILEASIVDTMGQQKRVFVNECASRM
jgi:tetratricopeptide (TPR) repeat protein